MKNLNIKKSLLIFIVQTVFSQNTVWLNFGIVKPNIQYQIAESNLMPEINLHYRVVLIDILKVNGIIGIQHLSSELKDPKFSKYTKGYYSDFFGIYGFNLMINPYSNFNIAVGLQYFTNFNNNSFDPTKKESENHIYFDKYEILSLMSSYEFEYHQNNFALMLEYRLGNRVPIVLHGKPDNIVFHKYIFIGLSYGVY